MLPSLVAREVIAAVRSQLRAQFPSTTRGFLRDDALDEGRAAIDDLLARPGEVFKGPYLSFGLPFRKAETPDARPFEHVALSDPLYLHQSKAYRRLASGTPQPTLVATGMGSGKTECFLFPLLEHCAATPAPGIKALIIYPMNALAQDQARRFAEEVHQQEGHLPRRQGRICSQSGLFLWANQRRSAVSERRVGRSDSHPFARNHDFASSTSPSSTTRPAVCKSTTTRTRAPARSRRSNDQTKKSMSTAESRNTDRRRRSVRDRTYRGSTRRGCALARGRRRAR